jgi:hypothetical protein
MFDEIGNVKPNWMLDGKGIRGDAQPFQPPPVRFPGAQITSIEPQFPVTSEPLNDPGTGGGPGAPAHAYSVRDATSNGTTQVIVTPGNHLDTTSGGTAWVPTIGGTAINAGTPPKLTVSSSDTMIWFKISVNPLDGSGTTPAGQITAIEIDSGSSLPANTNTEVYQVVDYITVNGSTSVTTQNGGVSGSQVIQPCGGSLLFGLQ